MASPSFPFLRPKRSLICLFLIFYLENFIDSTFKMHAEHFSPLWSEPPSSLTHLCYWNSFLTAFLISIIVPSNLFWKKSTQNHPFKMWVRSGQFSALRPTLPSGITYMNCLSLCRTARPYMLCTCGSPLSLSNPISHSPTHSSPVVQLVSESVDKITPSILIHQGIRSC